MKKIIKYYLTGIIAIFAMAIGTIAYQGSSYAIETTLTVSPMEQKMTIYPGEVSTGSIKVSNRADAKETLYYTVSAVPFTRTGDNYDPMVGEELNGSYNDIVSWVTFSSTSGALEPNETDEIIYTINAPKGTRGGGQYFAILVTRKNSPNTAEENSLNLEAIIQIASTVYVTVSGEDIQLAGTIKDNNIPSFIMQPPLTASFFVENTGNTHMEINYFMQVFPLFSNEEIYTNEENPLMATVLPGTTRYVTQSWKDMPQIGIFKVRQIALYGTDVENKSVSERIVVVCPLWLLFIIIFAIILIIFWLVAKSRGRKK